MVVPIKHCQKDIDAIKVKIHTQTTIYVKSYREGGVKYLNYLNKKLFK